jgi:hypothetical protein
MSFSDKFKKDSSKALEKKSGSFSDRFGSSSPGMDIKKYKKEESDDLLRQEKLYLVTGKDDGRDAWYYMLVPKLREPLFLKDIKRTKRSAPIIQFAKQVSDSALRISFNKSKKLFIKSLKLSVPLRSKILSETLSDEDAVEVVQIMKVLMGVKGYEDNDIVSNRELYKKIIKALEGAGKDKYKLALKKSDTIDLDDYGKIVESAYGKEPPESIKKYVEDKYG